MPPERLETLLRIVGANITKKRYRSREFISPAEKLVITLRYLATYESQQSQDCNFMTERESESYSFKSSE